MFSFFKRDPDRDDEADTARQAEDRWNMDALAEPEFAPPAPPPPPTPDPLKTLELKPRVVDVICGVFDPEIPVNIYELGLIYDIIVDAESRVTVHMTLTSPACPSAQQLPSEVRARVKAIEGVSDCTVEIVWEPPWSPDRMSDVARLQLGLM
jgi:FeS assembly SUF system protein